jgi:YVTN family beta-propeller protein
LLYYICIAADAYNDTVIRKPIPVGIYPVAIDVDLDKHKIYVANGPDTVSVIDGTSNTKIGDIPVGNNPRAIALDRLTNTIYVANRDDDTVSVIDDMEWHRPRYGRTKHFRSR